MGKRTTTSDFEKNVYNEVSSHLKLGLWKNEVVSERSRRPRSHSPLCARCHVNFEFQWLAHAASASQLVFPQTILSVPGEDTRASGWLSARSSKGKVIVKGMPMTHSNNILLLTRQDTRGSPSPEDQPVEVDFVRACTDRRGSRKRGNVVREPLPSGCSPTSGAARVLSRRVAYFRTWNLLV